MMAAGDGDVAAAAAASAAARTVGDTRGDSTPPPPFPPPLERPRLRREPEPGVREGFDAAACLRRLTSLEMAARVI